MRVLVDTSVWSEALRRNKKPESERVKELRCLILEHRVEIIGPIRQEILSGLREESQFERLEKQIAAFPDILLETTDFSMAAKFYNACRTQGVQGSNTDFLICAVAVRRDLSIFTSDKDFNHFEKQLPIVLHRIRMFEPDKSSKLGKPRR